MEFYLLCPYRHFYKYLQSNIPRNDRSKREYGRLPIYITPDQLDEIIHNDAVFISTEPHLYHKFGSIVIFRLGNLYLHCSPSNQHSQKIIYILAFTKNYHILKFVGQNWVRPKKTASMFSAKNSTKNYTKMMTKMSR